MLLRQAINPMPASYLNFSSPDDPPLKYGQSQGFAKTLSMHQTLDHLIQTRSIFIRLGDGEFPILTNRHGGFHRFSPQLKSKLLEAYYFALHHQSFMLGILPDYIYPFTHCNDPRLISSCRNVQIMDFLSFFPLRNYADAGVLRTPPIYLYKEKHPLPSDAIARSFDPSFYQQDSLGKTIFDYYQKHLIEPIKSLWKDHHLIICEGKFSHFGIHNDLLSDALSIQRVQSSNFNAFSQYESILQQALKTAENLPKEKVFFICALGHTSKILLVDLYKQGYAKGIDAGNLSIAYDSFLHSFPYVWVDSPIQQNIYPPLQYGIKLPIFKQN